MLPRPRRSGRATRCGDEAPVAAAVGRTVETLGGSGAIVNCSSHSQTPEPAHRSRRQQGREVQCAAPATSGRCEQGVPRAAVECSPSWAPTTCPLRRRNGYRVGHLTAGTRELLTGPQSAAHQGTEDQANRSVSTAPGHSRRPAGRSRHLATTAAQEPASLAPRPARRAAHGAPRPGLSAPHQGGQAAIARSRHSPADGKDARARPPSLLAGDGAACSGFGSVLLSGDENLGRECFSPWLSDWSSSVPVLDALGAHADAAGSAVGIDVIASGSPPDTIWLDALDSLLSCR